MKNISMPQLHEAAAIDATLAFATLAGLQWNVFSPLLPAGLDTILEAAGGNLLLVPSLRASGTDLETVSSLVALTGSVAIVVRPAGRTIVVDVVRHGDQIGWTRGCRLWTECSGSPIFLVHENGEGPAYSVTDKGFSIMPGQPWQDREDFTAGLVTASSSIRAVLEAR